MTNVRVNNSLSYLILRIRITGGAGPGQLPSLTTVTGPILRGSVPGPSRRTLDARRRSGSRRRVATGFDRQRRWSL